jgi:hypothetical protein
MSELAGRKEASNHSVNGTTVHGVASSSGYPFSLNLNITLCFNPKYAKFQV